MRELVNQIVSGKMTLDTRSVSEPQGFLPTLRSYILTFVLIIIIFPQITNTTEIYLSNLKFEEPVDANYWRSNPRSGINVRANAEFKMTANFRNSIFDSTSDFRYAKFDSAANFSEAHFHSTAYFESTFFYSTAYFIGTTFHSDADFKDTWFSTKVSFENATFEGKTSLSFARLPDTLDFRNVTINADIIDLTAPLPTGSGRKCLLALYGTDVSKLKLTMDNFELWFPANKKFRTTDTAFIRSDVGNSYDDSLSVYESVLKRIGEDGYMDSYMILDIKLRSIKFKHAGGPARYIINPFHKYWWNYGYEQWRVFLNTGMLYLLFFIINLFSYKSLNKLVYRIPFLNQRTLMNLPWARRAFLYVLRVSTYTALIFIMPKLSFSYFRSDVLRNSPGLFIYLMTIYSSGLICIGFIVNIIFTKY